MTTPVWTETVAADEAQRFEGYAAELAALQRTHAARAGTLRRGLHAKGQLVAHATFEVLGDVPAEMRVGLFGAPAVHPALVRFSNGSPAVQRDSTQDVRGIGVKVFGVPGPKVIPGLEGCTTQDFLAILTPTVPFRTPDEFVWVVTRAANKATFLPKALVKLGPSRVLSLVKALQRGARTVPTLAANTYFSALPIAFGAQAAKYGLVPLDGGDAAGPTAEDLGAELAARLSKAPVRWDFRVQLFADERSTPIEDPTVEWRTPWVTLARLTLPAQDIRSPRGQKLASWAEALSFDPWHAQRELRPLGAMMRSRSAAYRVSTQVRSAAAEPSGVPAELING
jgi:hypothetical protein